MANLCIIPARGGSKRIPRKNIKDFLGKPIIAYSIKKAIESELFDEIMVSTDDPEIARISLKLGAKVPFNRSKENSTNYATTFSVIKEVVENYTEQGKRFNNICCLYPCAPLVTKTNLIKGLEILQDESRISVIPIMPYEAPVQRALKIDNGTIKMLFSENSAKRTQDLAKAFYDAGQFYWANTNKLIKAKTLFTANSGYLIISSLEGQDIDTDEDWKMAEIKYTILNNG